MWSNCGQTTLTNDLSPPVKLHRAISIFINDACLNLPNTSLLLCYNPAQLLKMGGKHYLTGPEILARTNMDGEVISLTIDEVYLFQKYLASHSITLMADDQKLPCICID